MNLFRLLTKDNRYKGKKKYGGGTSCLLNSRDMRRTRLIGRLRGYPRITIGLNAKISTEEYVSHSFSSVIIFLLFFLFNISLNLINFFFLLTVSIVVIFIEMNCSAPGGLRKKKIKSQFRLGKMSNYNLPEVPVSAIFFFFFYFKVSLVFFFFTFTFRLRINSTFCF